MEQIEYPSQSLWNTILARPTDSYDSLEPLVKEVFDKVYKSNKGALIELIIDIESITPHKTLQEYKKQA